MDDIVSTLKTGRVLVADGAMGTMLQSAGLPSGMPPEAWLLENPDPVRDVHTAYLDAGADLILTCTFGGTRTRLERKGFADRVTQINHRAVEIARQAAAGRAYVAGDIGPLGQFLVPIGTLTPDEAIAAFAEQATALVEAGVDALYIETMSAMEEMHAAVEAAQQAAAGRNLPIFATFSFDHRGRTNMGVSPEQATRAFVDWQLTAFGANCGATLEMTNAAISTMHAVAPDAWLIAKPNAGIPHTVGGDVIYDATPEDMAIAAARFIDLGVRVVGGCCGSTPAHIAAVAAAVRR